MSSQSPSLRGLAALAALARHGRHGAAAAALGVTRSALSHRIADLEDELGVALTISRGRASALTDDGVALLAALGDSLDRIEAAVAPLRRRRRQLRVSTVDTLATNWLLPRLPSFRAAHPEIELALSTTRRPVDFDEDDIDCAIRHGRGRWDGLAAGLLFHETLAPVAAPGLETGKPAKWPAIAARSRFSDWARWWTLSGQAGDRPEPALAVENRAQALAAAVAGAGVALTDARYVEAHLAAGRLVRLGPQVELEEAYYLVHPQRVRNARYLAAFDAWLRAQAQAGPGA